MTLFSKKHCLVLVFILLHLVVTAQVHNQSWKQITESNDENWFASKEAIRVAENVLLYQRIIGGWPKNIQRSGAFLAFCYSRGGKSCF